jgi:hypothetical protein
MTEKILMARRKNSGKVYTDPEEYMKACERTYQDELKQNYEKIQKKKRGRPPKNKEQESGVIYNQGNFIIDFD